MINTDFMHDVDTTVQPLTMYTIAGIISPFVDQVEVIEPMKYRIANLVYLNSMKLHKEIKVL